MDELHTRLYQARGLRTVSALQKNAFDALYVATAAEAAEKVLAFVYEGARVGFGGSMTIKSMNIQELAAKKFFDLSSPAMSLSRAQMPSPWKALFSTWTEMGTALLHLALARRKMSLWRE